jgi:hypothetical protein
MGHTKELKKNQKIIIFDYLKGRICIIYNNPKMIFKGFLRLKVSKIT